MTVYFVTRHPGAREWAREAIRGELVFLESLEPEIVRPGDEVCGVLPAYLAAEVVRRGGIYRYVQIDPLPDVPRGSEMSAEQMRRGNARLVRFDVRTVNEVAPKSASSGLARLKHFTREESVPFVFLSALMAAAITPSGIGSAMGDMSPSDVVLAAVGTALLLVLSGIIARLPRLDEESKLIRALVRIPGIRFLTGKGWFVALAPGWNGPAIAGAVLVAVLAVGAGLAAYWMSAKWGALELLAWELLFLLFLTLGAWLGRGFFGIEIRQHPISFVAPRPLIVMFLSPLLDRGASFPLVQAEDGSFGRSSDGGKVNQMLVHLDRVWAPEAVPMTLAASSERDGFPGLPYFPWQQNFRVLNSQFGGANRSGQVVVITSRESHPQFPVFKATVERLAAESGVTLSVRNVGPIDPFWLSDMENALRVVVEDFRNERAPDGTRCWRDDQILIDVTSGSKLASIAAATATFGSDLLFSYVENDGVWLLDVRARLGQG